MIGYQNLAFPLCGQGVAGYFYANPAVGPMERADTAINFALTAAAC